MPVTAKRTGGSASMPRHARRRASVHRRADVDGSACRRRLVDDAPQRSPELAAAQHRPRARRRRRATPSNGRRQRLTRAPRPTSTCASANRIASAASHVGQRWRCRAAASASCGAGPPAAAGRSPTVTRTSKPRAIEQIAHRDDQPVRQQQHVEEQRADRGHAEDAEDRARRLAHQASPRESQRVHRRASRRPLRRSSAHDAQTVARARRAERRSQTHGERRRPA